MLAANEEQTIYPISLNEANTSHTSFQTTYLGGTSSYLRNLIQEPSFIGCTEDVQVNGEWVRCISLFLLIKYEGLSFNKILCNKFFTFEGNTSRRTGDSRCSRRH